MSRRTTCNELIDADQRELVIELFTESNKILADIAEITGVPIAKIKNMTAGMERPARPRPMTDLERTRLLMQW